MKILLDENFPKSLKKYFWNVHSVITVQEAGWNGKRNGELLKLLVSDDFDVLITADKNLHYQQNLKKYPIIIIMLEAKFIRPDTLEPLMPSVLKILASNPKKGLTIIK